MRAKGRNERRENGVDAVLKPLTTAPDRANEAEVAGPAFSCRAVGIVMKIPITPKSPA